MIFGELKKQNKIPVAYRVVEDRKKELTLMVLATNWKLAYSGCENQVNETRIVEASIEAMYSGNEHVVYIKNKPYTMQEILREYIDLACIKGIEKFLLDCNNIKEILDKLFSRVLENGIEYFNENNETQIEVNYGALNKKFQELSFENEDLKIEIIDDFESEVFEYLNFNNYILDYAKYENYNYEEIKHNKNRVEKLIDLYIWKQEWEGVIVGTKELYKGEFEKFIKAECKDMTITGNTNGR